MPKVVALTEVKLSEGISACIHPRTGMDQLIALTVHLRLDETSLLDDYKELDGLAFYKNNFAMAMAQTESLTGLDYKFPDKRADSDTMAEGFLEWIFLPSAIIEAWGMALLKDEMYNASALLPAAAIPAEERKVPLSKGSVRRRGKA